MTRLVLASASPRRRQLLSALGWDLQVFPADVDETALPSEEPGSMVRRLAVLKAERIAAELPEAIVVAADTTVVVDGAALAKPNDEQEACAMLMRLQGRSHEVLTGFCVRRGSEERADVVRTEVVFRPLSRHAVEAYVATGESLDKAGGYGIQGAGGALVERVSGSYSNVVGLPISEVLEAVAELACGGSKRSS